MGHSKKLRKIVVDGVEYLWATKHLHKEDFTHSECVEVLTIYLANDKKSPLKLLFDVEKSMIANKGLASEHWQVGHPENGVAWKAGHGEKHINLNRPGLIAEIIKHATIEAWHPTKTSSPTEITCGFDWLEQLTFPKEEARHTT